MKQIIICFLILGSLLSRVQAQDEDDDKFFNLGVKGVVNGSWLGNLPSNLQAAQNYQVNREDIKIGFVGGVWARLNLPIKGLFLQPELLISQNGGKYTYQFIPPQTQNLLDIAKNVTLTNFEFPLSLGYRIPLGPVGLRLNAGGVLSTILSAKQKYEATSNALGAVTQTGEQDIKSQINTLQAALQGGLGLDFSKLSLDFRLQQNLTDLYQNQGATDLTNLNGQLNASQQSQRVISGQIIIGFRIF
ncbi:MAG: PorT family protein [Microscillaceae bacterium]|nr:PorT family protein [Microscillaceae bacterium]